MVRPIDHLALAVTTLTLARSRLSSLGFTVAPDARHPFGTGNCCVFFQNRTYLEPVTILDRAGADMAAAEGVYFVRRLKRFTERQGDGFPMVAFRSEDAERDHREFEAAKLSAGPVFRFSRTATLPDGTAQEFGVVLAFTEDGAVPDATFFACQHLAPEVLFQRTYLEHPNGARGVAAVTAVAENPADFHILLSTVTGERDLRATSFGVEAKSDGHSVLILTPAGFRTRYGLEPPDPRRGLLLTAIEILVGDLDRAVGYCGSNVIRQDHQIVVPPAPGLSAVLAFRPEDG